ncbi:MAG TPA: TonB-dependent receptor, partial [Epsilonproteobacteria bacterium]|nr:TonB-dependent receptor [Campylobacterota bacterium]
SISVVHSAYSAQTLGNIKVKKGGSTSRTIKLTPASMELEEFVVLAPKVEGSIADIIQEEKNTNSIANIIGAEAFSKKGDSSAAAALKRASGITLVGGNVYVRGLGDRYGNIEMNSMPLPSPNPLKRLVPLDIFPASVIGAMKIQKSGEADIPASFGGGYINIRTKQSVTDDYIKISLGTGANSDTGDSVISQKGSSSDWTGYDDGYWRRPSSALSANEFTQAYFNRDMNTPYETLPLNFSAQIEAAKSYKIDEDQKISLFGTYKYSQKHVANYLEQSITDMVRDTLGIDFSTTPPTAQYGPYYVKKINKTTTESSSSTYSHGGIFDIGYNYLDVFKLNYTKLYTHEGKKSTSYRTIDDLSGANATNYTSTLRWIEKTLDVDQVNGEIDYQIFNRDAKFNFGLQRATSNFSNPNTIEYTFEDCPEHLRGTTQCSTGLRLPLSLPNFNSREESSEDVIDTFYLTSKFDIPIFDEKDYMEIGVSQTKKTRDFSSTPGRFIERAEINSVSRDTLGDYIGDIQTLIDVHGDILTFEESPLNNSAKVKASVDQKNAFTKFFINPHEKLEVIAGIRYADIAQTTSTIDPLNPVNNTTDTIELDKFFPSLSLRYKHNDDHNIDFAMSKTYIMPDLIEFADAVVVAPSEKRIDIWGNPDLQPTMISSIDLKYSYYFGENDYMKIGGFYKELKNPIEDTERKSASDDVAVYTFINSDQATIQGLEFDGRVGLGSFRKELSSFFLSGNYTYLDSKVTLTEDQALRLSTDNRQLQGLSQHILNLAVEYETDERSIVVAYNKMGERIRKIGYKDIPTTDSLLGIPDTYEIPPQVLDVVWKEKLSNGLDLRLKVGNILDE